MQSFDDTEIGVIYGVSLDAGDCLVTDFLFPQEKLIIYLGNVGYFVLISPSSTKSVCQEYKA